MALPATTIIEVRTTGSDTQCGGGFDPASSGFVTDLAATSATGSSPVLSSASYTFVSGDIGAYAFIKSGTNWTPGWYPIASVSAGAATLDASIGAVVLYNGASQYNTVAGCATTASPTSGTGGVDYSQQSAAQATGTATSASTTVTATTGIFSRAMVGNYITDGTTYKVITAYTSTTVVTVDSAPSWTAATIYVGGSLASWGKAAGIRVSGNPVHIKGGTYTLTTPTANVAGGVVNDTIGGTGASQVGKWEGYQTKRGDKGTTPLLVAPGSGTYGTLFASSGNYAQADNLSVDGGGNASASLFGFVIGNNYTNFIRLKADRCVKGVVSDGGNGHTVDRCLSTRHTTAGIVSTGNSGSSWLLSCESYGGTGSAVGFLYGPNAMLDKCISYLNGGVGFSSGSVGSIFDGCIAYGNGAGGWSLGSVQDDTLRNCISYGNTGGYGFGTSNTSQLTRLLQCAAGGNASGAYDATQIFGNRVEWFVTLTGDPFTDAANGDFSINNTAGAGAALRAAGYPGVSPRGVSTGYADIGAVQHQDSGGGTTPVTSLLLQNIGTY